MQVEQEAWRPAPGYEGLAEVSDQGSVRTLNSVRVGTRNGVINRQFKAGCILRPHLNHAGYQVVAPKVGAIRKKVFVHRLVGLAFVEGYREGMFVNHINGRKTDNRASNLEWTTLARNTELQWRDGLVDLRGENHPGHILTTEKVVAIKRLVHRGASLTDLAIVAGVSQATISFIKSGKRWRVVTEAGPDDAESHAIPGGPAPTEA